MGKITRRDVIGFNKTELVSKLSGQIDRINKKMREFRKLSDTAGEDYTNYVKGFINDSLFNSKGTLNKGVKNLGKMSENELKKLFMKTIAIGESPVMQTVNTYSQTKISNERDVTNTIQTQMEDLGIEPEIIDKFKKDPKQVYKFIEMLKEKKNPYDSDILKTFTEYADADDIELQKNMNRMLKAYETQQKEKKLRTLMEERNIINHEIGEGDFSNLDRLRELQREINSIRGNDVR